jgi:hypothetical protein
MSADLQGRPYRHLCPKADLRDAMPDDEFWADVYPQNDPFDDAEPPAVIPLAVEPCPVCGEQGACAYDAEGRPLIHTDTELPED